MSARPWSVGPVLRLRLRSISRSMMSARLGLRPVGMLEHHRLDQPQRMSVRGGDRRAGRAGSGHSRAGPAITARRGRTAPAGGVRLRWSAGQISAGVMAEQRGEQRQAIDADDRGELHHLVVGGERIAEQVERKAGEQVPRAHSASGRKVASVTMRQAPSRPAEMRQRAGEAPEQRDHRRQRQDGERHQAIDRRRHRAKNAAPSQWNATVK